ncbi:DUF2690 domain-containing protein [Streptomyces sp. NPDC012769]|uniref:DUF2690 domain-containing protein n=1 Tax=Streptomyces sp. NPDC012769 TaxID=3364848 RepID=UPI00369C11B6
MGVDGHEPATEPKQRLALLLRSWWEQDPGRVTQEALARRITDRGVRTSQEMLSRYLHRTRPTLARPDVVRALHAVLGRAPEELETALALHGEALAASRTPAAAPETPVTPLVLETPDPPDPPAGPEAPVAAEAPAASEAPAVRRARRTRIGVAAAVVVGVSVLAAVVVLDRDDRGEQARPPAGPEAPAGSLSATPTSTAECRGASCFGIDPKYSVCREDAVTSYTGSGHGIRVELRFSPTCQAAWARMSGTSQGDVARVTNNAGRSRHYTQQWGHDAHSTMVEALNPDDARACARTPRGEVCATVPVSS